MKNKVVIILVVVMVLGLLSAFAIPFILGNVKVKAKVVEVDEGEPTKEIATENMKLGAFSVSLSVKDLNESKQFYENLGFTVLGGDLKANYLIMKNENSIIGLFQGMFEGNILTFNPGWDENGKNIDSFEDIRVIQQQLKSKGVKLDSEADEASTGPASFMLTDPDGNLLLFDQHR